MNGVAGGMPLLESPTKKTKKNGRPKAHAAGLTPSRRVYERPVVHEQATTLVGPGGVPIAMASRVVPNTHDGSDEFCHLLGSFEEYSKPFVSMPSARDVDLDDEETRLKALNAGVSFWKQRAIHARSSSSISSNRAAVTSSKRAFGAFAGTSANASSEPMLSFPPQASLPSSSSSSYVSSSAVVLKTGGDFAFSPGADTPSSSGGGGTIATRSTLLSTRPPAGTNNPTISWDLCADTSAEQSAWQPAARMLSMRGADEAYGLAARGSGRYPLFRRERLKGSYRSKVPRASPRHVCWLIGCAILAFLMLCAAILYIACLQPVHFSIRSGRLTVTVAAAGNDGTNPAAEFGEGRMGVVRLQWSNYTIENPNMLPQYLKGLNVALMGIRDAQDKHWFDFQNETRRKEGGHVLAWTFPLHCKNTQEQTGNCSRVVPAFEPFAPTHPGMSFAVHGGTRLGAADAATVFSRNVTEGAAWPPVLLLRVVVRYVNPLFGAGTPHSIDEVSCVAVGKKESEGLGTAEWEGTAPAGMAARQQTIVFSCRTKYFQ